MKGNIFKVIVIWTVGLALVLSTGGILYNFYENSRATDKIVQRQTLDTAKQLLDVQGKLEKNGEIAAAILHKVVDNQEILLTRTKEILATQIDEVTQKISDHQVESRKMFMEEFKEVRKDTERIIAEQLKAVILNLVDKKTYDNNIVEIFRVLKENK